MGDKTTKFSVFLSKGKIPRILSMSKHHIFLTFLCAALVLSIILSYHLAYLKMQSHQHVYCTSRTCNCTSQANTATGTQSHKQGDSRQNNTYRLFTYINHAYLPLALSWLCNTLHMDVHHNVLFFVSHNKTKKALHAKFPNVPVVTVSTSSTQSDQDFSTVGYLRLMVERTRFIQKLLLQGLDVLLFEVDCLWLKNPVQDLLRNKHYYDFVFTHVTDHKKMIAGNFIFVFNTQKTRRVWDELTDRMNQLEKRMLTARMAHKILNNENDQTYLSQIIFAKKTHTRHKILPEKDYPDGKWYSLAPKKRLQYKNASILNNNWIVGNANKIHRAKQWHHWFLYDNMTCNQHYVNLIQTSPQTFIEVSPN